MRKYDCSWEIRRLKATISQSPNLSISRKCSFVMLVSIDVMITIDPVVGGRWWRDRAISPPMVSWVSVPFKNIKQAYNLLAENDAYGSITPWDQGVEVPGAENRILPGTDHCSIGHANCAGTVSNFIPMPTSNGEVNAQTEALIVNYLQYPGATVK